MKKNIANVIKVPMPIIVLSLLVAIFVDIKPINWIFAYGGTGEAEESGIMGILYPAIAFLIVLFSFSYRKIKWHLNATIIFLVLYLSVFYYISNSLIGPSKTVLTFLMAFVLSALVIPSIAVIDAKSFLRAVMTLPSIAIFRLERVFSPMYSYSDVISMDVSYAFLIPIVATIVYLTCYLKYDQRITKCLMIFISVINLVFLIQIFLHGSRGPLLSVILLVLFLMVVKKREFAPGISYSKGKLGFVFLFMFVFLACYVLFLQTIMDILSFAGVESHAIDKILELIAEGDLSNGRANLNTITINGIIEHLFFGNGFDRYHANTGMLYPHNFILQILYDGGLLYFFVILTPVVMGIVRICKKCNNDEYSIMTFLFFSSVPGALFSNNLYASSILWLFFGFTVSKYFIYKPKLMSK